MIAYLKKLTIRNIVSPYGLAAISYCIFLFAWLFPPDLYTQYVGEPDLMFLDPLTLVFYTACVGAFLIGVWITRPWQVVDHRESPNGISARMPLVYLLGLLLPTILACAVYMVLVGTKLNSVVLLASQQGQALKTEMQTANLASSWAAFLVILTTILWWALFRAQQFKFTGISTIVFYAVFSTGVLVVIITCVVRVDRTNLMPLIAGLFVIYLYCKTRGRNVSVRKLLFAGSVSAFSLIGGFLVLSFLRGALVLRLLLISLMGYTIVSYNRLAALLGGIMHYAYEGRGVYLAYILTQDETAEVIRTHLGWPNSLDLWRSEFASTFSAGLNPAFIWSGAFGYLYSDVGWWTLLYLFFVGVLAGCLWRRFTSGEVAGLVLYPWMSFCILFWIGNNCLLDGRTFRLIEMVFVLSIYDWIFLRRRGAPQEIAVGFRSKDQLTLGGHPGGL